MMNLVEYFDTIPSSHRTFILVGGLVFFWMIESIIPLFKRNYKYIKHAGANLFFTLTTIGVNFAFAYLIVFASDYMYENKYGIINLIAMPLWLYVITGCMVLDLIGAYFIHFIQHKIKWMWKFHIVHHSDMHVDTTTANRHHPVESLFRAAFTLIAVIVAGAPMWLVMVYQSVSAVLSQFNHANISLPRWIDTSISWIIVSPNMHKVHHHYIQPLTDTNYGNIFSIWDRIFRTFAKVKDTKKDIVYGIDLMMKEKDSQEVGNLLAMPFKNYQPLSTSKFAEK
ncbi:MAG: sterol desaturase family protein [Fimbriimonadaceae bacterium]|nr:sterol desaturase family protein [Chitinophagales bacterium]